jgi:hypothetical protein
VTVVRPQHAFFVQLAPRDGEQPRQIQSKAEALCMLCLPHQSLTWNDSSGTLRSHVKRKHASSDLGVQLKETDAASKRAASVLDEVIASGSVEGLAEEDVDTLKQAPKRLVLQRAQLTLHEAQPAAAVPYEESHHKQVQWENDAAVSAALSYHSFQVRFVVISAASSSYCSLLHIAVP